MRRVNVRDSHWRRGRASQSEIPHECLDLRCLDLRCLDSRRTSRTKGGRPTSNIEVMFSSFEDYNAIRMSEFRGLNVFIEISV